MTAPVAGPTSGTGIAITAPTAAAAAVSLTRLEEATSLTTAFETAKLFCVRIRTSSWSTSPSPFWSSAVIAIVVTTRFAVLAAADAAREFGRSELD